MFDKGFSAGPDAAASDELAAGPVDAPGRVEAMLSALQHLGHVGVWDLDIATGTMWWSDGLYTIHGYPPDSFPASPIGWWRTHILVTERRSPNNYTH